MNKDGSRLCPRFDRKKTAKTRKSLRAYDLIEGPVARKRRNEVSDETVYDPKPSSYQMCLNSDDFADTFRKTLHSIIFLKICQANYTLYKKNRRYYVKKLSLYSVVTISAEGLVMQQSSACCAARAREYQCHERESAIESK